MRLLKCVSRRPAVSPYRFKYTDIRVYSFEEALYHCLHYWKESLDDFCSADFICWVNDELGLPHIASAVKDAAGSVYGGVSKRMVKFLSLTDYYDEDELSEVGESIAEWEKRLEWERLMDRGDHFNNMDQPSKAYPFYSRALLFSGDARLLNNAGICLMKLNNHGEAVKRLSKACEADPYNLQIRKNLTEALIYDRQTEKASSMLEGIAREYPGEDIFYLYGELNYETGNILQAAEYYEKSLSCSSDPNSARVYRLAEIYVKLRFYDRALETMDRVKIKDADFLIKQADINAACDNIPAAVKCIEKALLSQKDDARLWVKLAQFYRLSYDSLRAGMAIKMALDIEPESAEVLLENARIKKLSGKTREYQQILKSILQNLKTRYRTAEAENNIL